MSRSLGKIGEAFVELTVKQDQLQAQFQAAQRTARRSSDRMAKSIDRVDTRLARAGKTAVTFGRTLAALGTGAVIAALGNIVRNAAQVGDEIAKTADRVGVGVEALQELRFAADRSGVGTRTLDTALQRFSRRVGEAAQGGGELSKTLKQYGIEVKNADGSTRANVDVLGDLADVIASTTSEQEKLRIAFKAFDSQGAALVNLLRQGSDGMDELRNRARDLGNVMSEETARAAEEAQDALTDFNNSVGSLGQTLASNALGPLTTFIQLLTDITQIGIDQFTRDLEDFSLRGLRFELNEAVNDVDALKERIERFASGSRGPNQEGRIALLNKELEEAEARVKKVQGLIEERAPTIDAAPLNVDGITPSGVEVEIKPAIDEAAASKVQERIDKLVASLERQREIAGLSGDQQIALGQALDRLGIAFEVSAGKVRVLGDEFENLDRLSDELGNRVEFLNAEEVAKTQRNIDDLIASLAQQRDVAGLTNTAQQALAETLSRLGIEFELAGGQVRILSDEFRNLDELARQVAENDALANPPIPVARPEVQGPQQPTTNEAAADRQAKKFAEIERAQDQASRAADRFGSAVADSFADAILGAESFKSALGQVLETLARVILEQAVLQPLAGAIAQGSQTFLGALAGGAGAGVGGAAVAAAQGAVVSGNRISGGRAGVITRRNITPLAAGGILTGEAGSEIVVPMSPSRIGPFLNAIAGSGGGGADGPSVQVIDKRGSEAPAVEVSERQQGGRRVIEALVRDQVNTLVDRGGGDSVFGSRFGVRPQPGRLRG